MKKANFAGYGRSSGRQHYTSEWTALLCAASLRSQMEAIAKTDIEWAAAQSFVLTFVVAASAFCFSCSVIRWICSSEKRSHRPFLGYTILRIVA